MSLQRKERADKLREVEADIRAYLRHGRQTRGWTDHLSITEVDALIVRAVEDVISSDAAMAKAEGEALAQEYTQGWWTPALANGC